MHRNRKLYWKIFQIFVCEALGAGIVCLPALMLPPTVEGPNIANALISGIAVFIGLFITGATSGGQMNPVVTMAAAITRRIPLLYVPVYWIAQFAGSLIAMGFGYWLSPFRPVLPSTYGLTRPPPSSSDGLAIAMEILITMTLVMTWLASLDEVRNRLWRLETSNNFPLAMMLAITMGAAIGGPVSGASMNPWRSLTAAIVQRNFAYVWIYFVGPPIGSLLACLLYELVICQYSSSRRTKKWFTSKNFDRSERYTDESDLRAS